MASSQPVSSSPTSGVLTSSPTEAPVSPSATAAPTAPPAAVEVSVITSDVVDGVVEVTGIVLGGRDTRGVCTLTLVQGSVIHSAEGRVSISVGNAFCPLLAIPVSALGPGSWEVSLSYSGVEGAAVSAPVTVSIP